MVTYLVRRLLLMIPTILGVTLVSFLVMQLAPGDPLLAQGEGKKGASESSHEMYLIQKRSLGLDKPAILNFNGFRDYRPSLEIAAHFLASTQEQIREELAALASVDRDAEAKRRHKFLTSLQIPNFETRLKNQDELKGLAQSVVDFVQVWCEDAGASAVPAAMRLLNDEKTGLAQRRGIIRALNHMLSDPFVYTYSRTPDESETPAVTASWRLWWQRQEHDFDSLSDERKSQLEQATAKLAAAKTRNDLMDGLQRFRKSDVPFFAEKLLDESSLAEKNVAAWMLRLYVGKPLASVVSLHAKQERVKQVAENWQAYYEANHHEYEQSLGKRIWKIVADTQYANLLRRLSTFDFGPSALPTREPVGERIWRAFKVSAPLMLGSQALIYLIAVPLGIICAVYRGRFLDRFISFILFVLYSVPTFAAAMVLLLLFCYGSYARWFPTSGMHSAGAGQLSWGPWMLDYAWHMFLPIVCLSLFSLAGLAMYSRASMLDVIGEDYVRTARGKGVSERRVIWVHALRNALIPVITLFADFLPAMLGGSVLVEVLFSIPGMGRLSWSSIEQKDYPTLMALVYIDAIVALLSILLSDVLYSLVDPRISPAGGEEAL